MSKRLNQKPKKIGKLKNSMKESFSIKKLLHNSALWLILLLFSVNLNAQDNMVSASAPAFVTVNRAFNYTISGDVKGDVELPSVKGIRILGGPSQSVSSSTTIINGRMESQTSVSYSYMLMATEEGDFEIGPAIIKTRKKDFKTNVVNIKALKGTNSATPTEGANTTTSTQSEGVILKLIPSRKDLYVGEQLTIDTRVYVNQRLQITDLKNPSFEGFWTEELDPDNFASQESLNGQLYRTQVIKRDLLTAQKAGIREIEEANMDVSIEERVQSQRRNFPFDDPFGSYRQVPAVITSLPLKINVKPLPSGAPESFGGAVGKMNFSVKLNKDSTFVNEAISLNIVISGKGNLSLMSSPKVDFPPDLEVFEPKRINNVKHSASGTEGTVSFEYLIIPRQRGEYRIPPIGFSYFDPGTAKYIKSDSKELIFKAIQNGESGNEGNTDNQITSFFREDVKNLDSDIRFIRTQSSPFIKKDKTMLDSGWLWAYPFGILLMLIIALIRNIFISRQKDQLMVRNRRARRVAIKQLKTARSMLKTNDDSFYEAILRACWGYLSDKLGINTAELSRNRVADKLEEKGLSVELREELLGIIETCEFARYAPGGDSAKHDIYKQTEDCLSKVEQNIR
jgi:BatD DUF11 like domain